MVEHHVEQHADAAGVSLGDQLAQLVFRPHVGVQAGEVQGVVTVVGVMAKVALVTAADPAMDLLEGRADPQCVDPQLLQVVELAGQAAQVAAMEGTDLLLAVGLAAVAAVVAGIAIGEAVGDSEIHRGIAPVVGGRWRRLGWLEQEQAVAMRRRGQLDTAVFHRGQLAAVGIAQHLAIGEYLADRDAQRLALPGAASAARRLLAQRQQAQMGLGVFLKQQAIAAGLADLQAE